MIPLVPIEPFTFQQRAIDDTTGDETYYILADTPIEHEIPEWLAALILGTTLHKAAGHKYIRRVPTGKTTKTGKPVYRYFYNVTGGEGGLGHEDELVQGAGFRVKHEGRDGHFHIESVQGDQVTIVHDESGHRTTMTKRALRSMLHREHAQALRSKAKQHAEAGKRKLRGAAAQANAKAQEKSRGVRAANVGASLEERGKVEKPEPKLSKQERLKRISNILKRVDDWSFAMDRVREDSFDQKAKYAKMVVKLWQEAKKVDPDQASRWDGNIEKWQKTVDHWQKQAALYDDDGGDEVEKPKAKGRGRNGRPEREREALGVIDNRIGEITDQGGADKYKRMAKYLDSKAAELNAMSAPGEYDPDFPDLRVPTEVLPHIKPATLKALTRLHAQTVGRNAGASGAREPGDELVKEYVDHFGGKPPEPGQEAKKGSSKKQLPEEDLAAIQHQAKAMSEISERLAEAQRGNGRYGAEYLETKVEKLEELAEFVEDVRNMAEDDGANHKDYLRTGGFFPPKPTASVLDYLRGQAIRNDGGDPKAKRILRALDQIGVDTQATQVGKTEGQARAAKKSA